MVLADGTLVKANAQEHEDLFWAVRGGGEAPGPRWKEWSVFGSKKTRDDTLRIQTLQ